MQSITAVDVLIPVRSRPSALAVCLTSLSAQTFGDFRIVILDSAGGAAGDDGEASTLLRLFHTRGTPVEVHHPVAGERAGDRLGFLLEQVRAPAAVFLDDDVLLEPFVLDQLHHALQEERCGFVGSAAVGLAYLYDVRPYEQDIEFWEGAVVPETVNPESPAWERFRLHHAANLYHVQTKLGLTPEKPKKYRVSWLDGCVMYDTAKLRACGGFSCRSDLAHNHGDEHVRAQLRVLSRFGGCGLVPSGVYRQEHATVERDLDAAVPVLDNLTV
jgi:GT2 family glycosyltransferase